ncbi:MAG TPA: putative lipid II flippase FtsW [Vicinamibacterales bacterium]
MARTLKSDKGLFLAVLFLVCVSAVMVSSASAAAALQKNWDLTRYVFKQTTWVAVGFLLLAVTMRINYRAYQQPIVIWSGLGLVTVSLLLVLVFAPEINGSRRWFAIGGVGVQPSEFAKLAIVLFLADMLARRMEKVNELWSVIIPCGGVVGILVGLTLLQPDLGTSAFIALLAVSMIFVAGLGYRYLAGVAAVCLPTLAALIAFSPRRAERLERVMAWIDPWQDPLGGGFQIIQSFIAVGSGGITGRGFMQGLQKIGFLPEPQTDFIYAVIAEEFGLIGTTLVLLAFFVIAWRGFRITLQMPDRYGAFLALGLTALIVVQALFNMSVVLGILPNKGLPLPFVSAGGSSMLVSMLATGILLNLSQHTAPRMVGGLRAAE